MASPLSLLDVRRENLRALAKKWGGPGSFAKKMGWKSGSYYSQLAGPNPNRDISEQLAREVEEKLVLRRGWLDREHPADAGEPRELDTSLVAEAARVVTLVIADSGKSVHSAKVGEMVSLVYEHAAQNDDVVDEAYARRLLKLMT